MRRTNGASVGGGARNSICHVPRADRWSTLRIRSSMVYRQTTGSDRSTASAATLSLQASVSKNPRHYLGFPGKARSALPLLSPSEVDPPASARAERPPFDTFTATTRDATRNEDPPPPGLRPVWVKLRRISIIPAFPVNLQRRNAYRQADTAGQYQFQKCGLPEVTFSAAPHDAVAPQVRSPHRPGPMDIPSSQTGQATFATVRA